MSFGLNVPMIESARCQELFLPDLQLFQLFHWVNFYFFPFFRLSLDFHSRSICPWPAQRHIPAGTHAALRSRTTQSKSFRWSSWPRASHPFRSFLWGCPTRRRKLGWPGWWRTVQSLREGHAIPFIRLKHQISIIKLWQPVLQVFCRS